MIWADKTLTDMSCFEVYYKTGNIQYIVRILSETATYFQRTFAV